MNISIDTPSNKFTLHLSQSNNNRILFSGKFGVGKSYFLKKYFENFPEYNVFWLSPINYVVGANEDIFEWIKVDIARELLTNFISPSVEDRYSTSQLVQSYILNNVGAIFGRLIRELSTQVSKKIEAGIGIDIAKPILRELDELKAYEEQMKYTEFGRLEKFISNSSQIKGTFFENDLITRILRNCLELVKLNEPDRKNVLVIDDLDRLDPEHIFRILNILSAHKNHFDKDKFGFDVVILVCDQTNIEHLYKHRYGYDADFEGYIEKFFSLEPFNYSLEDAIINYCETIPRYALSDECKTLLTILLVGFIKCGALRVRNIKKITAIDSSIFAAVKNRVDKFEFEVTPENGNIVERYLTGTYKFEVSLQYDVLKVLCILKIAFGGIDKLLAGISILKERKDGYDKDLLPHVIDSIATFTHISKMHSQKRFKTFYSWRIPNQGAISRNVVYQHYPEAIFFNTIYHIKLKWNENNKYKGGDYFKDANHSDLLTKTEVDLCTYERLANEMIGITKFAVLESLLY